MPPVASPETTCWIMMSILSGGERAPLLPHAPPPLRSLRRDSRWLVHRSVFGALINWFIGPSVSEIGAADGVVLFELGGGSRHHDPAGLEEVGVVGEVEGHRRVLLHQEDAHALLRVDRPQDAEDLRDHEGGQAERGLVEQEQGGAGHERPGDRQHLLLAPRERARLLSAPLGEDREVPVDLLVVLTEARLLPSGVGAEPQILLDGQIHERAAPLGGVRDPEAHDVLGGLAVDSLAIEAHLTAGLHHSTHRPERRGLAGSVGAEDRGNSAALHRERESVEDLGPAVLGGQVFRLQESRHQFSLPRYARMTSGSRWIIAGGPSAIRRPKSSTTTRSDTCMTRLMWCSTRRTVTPRRSRIERRTSPSAA